MPKLNMFTAGGRYAKIVILQGTDCLVDIIAVRAAFMPCSMVMGTCSQHIGNEYRIANVVDLF